MRLFVVLFLALSFTSIAAAAQTPRTPSRWMISAGPEWSVIPPTTWGMRVRADYDLVGRNSPVRIGLLMSGSWGPTQSWSYPLSSEPHYRSGIDQRIDLMAGVTAAVTPLPRAPVSPYFTVGMMARQTWITGTSAAPYGSYTKGQIFSSIGWGVRVRIGGAMFQIERRMFYDVKSLTFGMSIPFKL